MIKVSKFSSRIPISISRGENQLFRIKDQKRWAFALTAIVVGTFVANIGLGIESMSGISQELISLGCKLVILLSLIRCAPSFLYQNILSPFVTTAVLLFIILGQSFSAPEYSQWFNSVALEMVTIVFPFLLCIEMIDDFSTALRYLINGSFLISILLFLLIIAYGGNFFTNYSMGFSDSLIIPTDCLMYIVFCRDYTKRKKLFATLCITVNLLAILIYGSRGSLLCVAVFLMYLLLRDYFRLTRRRIILLNIVCLIIIGIILFRNEIISYIADLAETIGFESRTIVLLLSDNITHDSGRIDVWIKVLEDCIRNPMALRGICSTYPLVGNYSHSIVLDTWHNFGLITGSWFLLVICYFSIRTIRHCNFDSSYGKLNTLLFFTAFPLLLWSGTFWTNPFFWGWIVLSIRRKLKEL